MTLVQQIADLRDQDDCEARVDTALSLIGEADAAGDPLLGVRARLAFLEAQRSRMRPTEAVAATLWCLAHPHPELTDDERWEVLVGVDQATESLIAHPEVAYAQVDALLESYRERLGDQGIELNSYHQYRHRAAFATGRLEEAAAEFDRWLACPRDDLSDQPVVQCCYRARWYRHLGDHERVLREANEHLGVRTSSQPWWLLSEMLPSLIATGREDEARQAIARVRRKSGYVWTEEHTTCLHALLDLGCVQDAATFAEELLDRIDHPHVTPALRLGLGAALTRTLTAADDDRAAGLREQAYALAGRFDQRNANTWVTSRVALLTAGAQ